MTYAANVLVDSINEHDVRLTSIQVNVPRMVLPELISHRALSRNSASSRAIPVNKLISSVLDNPFIPDRFGANQSGMVAEEFLGPEDEALAREAWLRARDLAVLGAVGLNGGIDSVSDRTLRARLTTLRESYDYQFMPVGASVHKQLVNRLIEPWMWGVSIVSATDWDNFLALRTDRNAQPQIQQVALHIQEALEDSEPSFLSEDQWHAPLIQPGEMELFEADYRVQSGDITATEMMKRIAVGRCARVSYLTHDGRRDPIKDIELHNRLLLAGHMSPFEQVARPMTATEFAANHYAGNFKGWVQLRKTIPGEHNFAIMREYAAAQGEE